MAYRGVEGSSERTETTVFPPATDLGRWSLEVEEGRQVREYCAFNGHSQIWRHVESKDEVKEPIVSAYHVGLDAASERRPPQPRTSVEEACRDGLSFFSKVISSALL